MLELFRLKPESEQMLTLDVVRFVAAAGVIIQHYYQGLIGHERLSGGSDLDFLSLFVDIFFIISGFVISSVYGTRIVSSRDYLSFMQKRLARIAPLHWSTLLFIASIGGVLILIGRPSNFPDMYDWHCFIPNALFVHAFGTCQPTAFNYPSWSISAEMAMYLVFPAFMVVARQKRSLMIGISIVTLVAMYMVSGGPSGNESAGWTNWTTNFGAVRGLAGFSLGVAIYAYHDSLRHVRAALPLMLLSLAAFIALGLADVAPMWLAPLPTRRHSLRSRTISAASAVGQFGCSRLSGSSPIRRTCCMLPSALSS